MEKVRLSKSDIIDSGEFIANEVMEYITDVVPPDTDGCMDVTDDEIDDLIDDAFDEIKRPVAEWIKKKVKRK